MDSRQKAAPPSARKEAKKEFSFYLALEKLLQGLSSRSQHIARERFGVNEKGPKTLEEIGGEYRITRERVRQIIRSVMKDIQAKRSNSFFQVAAEKIESTLKERSGILKESDLLEELGRRNAKEEGAVRFFLECLPGLSLVKEDGETSRSYTLASFSLGEWKKVKNAAEKVFEQENRLLDEDELFERFVQISSVKLTRQALFHYLAVSKKIQANVFGKWGLASWSDI
jgi:hypothetical protein